MATKAMPETPPAMRDHLEAAAPGGHGMDSADGMSMSQMAARHDRMHQGESGHDHPSGKAAMSAADVNDLPDSAFAYIEPGGKVVGGRTEPRSLRHYPIHDAAHVRNALARASAAINAGGEQARIARAALPKIRAAAERMDIGTGKAVELKAEPMETAKLERWLSGKMPRRILVAPFYGPLKASLFGYDDALGRDLDGEYFHPGTDFYGDYPSLKASKVRAVDWHHDNDPTGVMKGAIIGNIVLDDVTEDDGLWADFWANAGEKRRKLVADLELRGTTLYGSTQPVRGGIRKAEAGRIDVWPIAFHTISTSPQNTWASVPPLKAFLGASNFDELPADAIKALLVGLDTSGPELPEGLADAAVTASALSGSEAVKAGRVLSKQTIADLERVLAVAEQELPALIRELLARGRPNEVIEPNG